MPTVEDLKVYLNKTGTGADDNELVDMLDAAVNVVESIVGSIGSTTITETHYGLHSDVLVLKQPPALALTSLTGRLYPGVTASTYTLTDYVLDTDTGIVRTVSGLRFVGDITVTYTAGRTTIPPAVTLATLIIAGHLWQTQRGGGSVRPSFPGDANAADVSGSPGYLIPYRAEELLKPYAQHRMA